MCIGKKRPLNHDHVHSNTCCCLIYIAMDKWRQSDLFIFHIQYSTYKSQGNDEDYH